MTRTETYTDEMLNKHFLHAKERLKQRFDIDLTPELHNLLVSRIKSKKQSILVSQKTEYLFIYQVPYDRQLIYTLFDTRGDFIRTFYPCYYKQDAGLKRNSYARKTYRKPKVKVLEIA